MLRILSAILLVLFGTQAALAMPEIGKPAPEFSATDHNGKTVRLSDFEKRIVVLEWHNPECPFVKKHYGSGNMQKLQEHARANNAAWLIVNSGAAGKQGHLSAAQAAELMAKEKIAADHYLMDESGAMGRMYAAKTTPHLYVVNDRGILVYMGAIDDRPSTDIKDIEGAHNYVRAALDSVKAGTPVAVASTQAYGCPVKY